MECWSNGVMEYWSNGVLEYGRIAVSEKKWGCGAELLAPES